MPKSFKIYTCGNGIDSYDDMDWRNKIEVMLRRSTDYDLSFAHPPKYYSYIWDSENNANIVKEGYAWELSNIADCDIVIICTDSIEDSAPCIAELAFDIGYINALNRNGKNIKIISFGEKEIDFPWFTMATHFENSMENAVDYIANLILV